MRASPNSGHGRRFPYQVDPLLLDILLGGVLLGCGILIGHMATVAVG